MVPGGLVRPGRMATAFPHTLLLMSICVIVFIGEIFYFWEVITSFILDILEYKVKSDDIFFPEVSVESYDFTVALR